MSLDPEMDEFATWRDKVVLGLAVLAALGSFYSFSLTMPAPNSINEGVLVQGLIASGELIFGILYLVLAYKPRAYRGLWEVSFLHRILLIGIGLNSVSSGVAEAAIRVFINLAIISILVAAYIFGKGYLSWKS